MTGPRTTQEAETPLEAQLRLLLDWLDNFAAFGPGKRFGPARQAGEHAARLREAIAAERAAKP